jgi:peptide/nickel transport system substrate-binding protein
MKALDPSSAIDIYYGGEAAGLAEPIYRSMSKTSWVYDHAYEGGATRHDTIAFSNDKDEILDLVAEAGWLPGGDGKLYKEGKPLKLVFTIAGATDDHPAYTMFQNAAEFLNECGFDVSVVNDVSALVKLQSGSLEVWAAAWSSTIDPDMYQVYHKDSQATSVLNWGYDAILNDLSGKYERELEIVTDLSEFIDQGREKLTEEERAPIYEKALDKLMELAVEFPTYQRCDLCVLNKDVINVATINQNPSANSGIIDRVWEINYN